MKHGFVAIGLQNPKNTWNVGSVMRAAGCFDSDLIIVGGARRLKTLTGLSSDTQNAWRHIPMISIEDIFDAMPLRSIPIAVDILPNAKNLVDFKHPERAFYIFGPEDGTLGERIHSRCAHALSIPTSGCMNLAAAVNVVLYDRAAKLARGE